MPKEEKFKNEDKLARLFSLMNNDGLTEKKFLTMAKKLAEAVKKSDAKLMEAVRKMIETSKNSNDKMNSDNEITKTEIREIVKKEIARMTQSFDNKNKEIDDFVSRITNGIDGLNADEEVIVQKVLENIKIPTIEELKKDLPTMSQEIRDAFELLGGEERPDISSIRGLRSILRKLEERPLGKGGGGFSYIHMDRHILDDESFVGTQNGINKDFTIEKVPNPLTSLKVYRGGARQRITEDYTVSGKTVSFLVAPVAGEVLFYDLRF